MNILRKCQKCEIEKPLSEFHNNKTKPLGKSYWCKTCHNAHIRIRDNSPKSIEKHRKYILSERGKEMQNARQRKDYRLNKHKYTAKRDVQKAIIGGIIKRKPCEICDKYPSVAHHPNYARPLEVVWRCHRHHAEEHRKIRESVL